jgi:hypothetical protein
MTRGAIALLALLAALAAAGCGGGGDSASGADPDTYAHDVCGAIQTWQQSLTTGANNMSKDLGAGSTPAQVKGKLVDFMGAAVAATDKMVADVKAAGPPAVDDGEKLQADLEAGLQKADDAFKDAKASAEKLDTSSAASFQQGATDLQQTLQTQGTAIQTTFEGLDTKYNSKDLNEAFDKEPACKSL